MKEKVMERDLSSYKHLTLFFPTCTSSPISLKVTSVQREPTGDHFGDRTSQKAARAFPRIVQCRMWLDILEL
jgi:hypothetical protein